MTTDPSTPTSYLNYRGDVRQDLPETMGPGTDGELRYVVDAEYDPETDRTRVGLSKINPNGASL